MGRKLKVMEVNWREKEKMDRQPEGKDRVWKSRSGEMKRGRVQREVIKRKNKGVKGREV